MSRTIIPTEDFKIEFEPYELASTDDRANQAAMGTETAVF